MVMPRYHLARDRSARRDQHSRRENAPIPDCLS